MPGGLPGGGWKGGFGIDRYIISTNGKQLKQPEANTDLLYFSALSCYKSSVETNFPMFAIAFSH